MLPACLQPALARCVGWCLIGAAVLQIYYSARRWNAEPVIMAVPAYRIDINQAGWEELIQLPRVGETMARRIVADREARGPFASTDDLTRVRGIGPKTAQQIQPYLRHEPVRRTGQPVN